ncbi:hypothetical protein EMIHUDRAFT_199815 [Emiliania huxleyi CCMP1516]|uniref:Glycosyl transferase 64 domain-containing protein n=2 Tax=Emiliania huxleyi TaxID=2903 RepID=A0A0D3JIX1_EMIH1|nr:hypothetical protein EMIHUDRAFT_239637 [Emiliania huxleyi CCMP1516]XP_005793864.1 hypothetical protein EMIHUDRAFT_199815 [Emiliania huxleyi CCMP1516]EOD23456.1 hypothetical protein EMIHUDRAFT_239637 [Emiliania huxleyi CCMP1516]EOD41435.1 hypothetical protein EMIHUDRAFT_199815 [Emiliania huxleyi CCMP1516]|eukprot:XP_005775885.1 hypothetical protein EMIHUDRAFT_239637 [Emiliania huxleyi CCMP1516]
MMQPGFARGCASGAGLATACALVLAFLAWRQLPAQPGQTGGSWGSNGISESSSGALFRAVKVRSYQGPRRFADWRPRPDAKKGAPSKECRQWAVVTSIFPPTQTVRQLAALPSWCVVVAGDKKGPVEYNLSGEALPFESKAELRWNHFGRKNLGFLYAIQHGARWVYDTDDDNELLFPGPRAIPIPPPDALADEAHLPWRTWPRGFPLESIKDNATTRAWPSRRIGVFQSLANHDPDGSMMPYNAQATLHAQRALWSLLLPCSVHGRVTDIWRAYFAQRLLWDVGLRLAFSPPWVVQFRNAHNYLADFNSEVPLYQQAGALVGALLRWQPAARTLPGRFEELYVHMYELGIVGLSDVRLAQAWLADLDRIGYPFPPILDRPPRAVKPARSGGVRERHGERRAATSGAGQAT